MYVLNQCDGPSLLSSLRAYIGLADDELNRFPREHRILSVDRKWLDSGTESFRSFCVDYLETVQSLGPGARPLGESRGKVDYREA